MVKKVIKLFEIIGGVSAGILFLTVLWQVAARVIFKVSSTWTVEVGRALFVIMVFFGSPVLLYRDNHMTIKTLIEKLEGKKLNVVQLIIDVVVLFTLIAMAYGCYDRTVKTWNDVIPTVEWITSGKVYGMMFIGVLAMIYVSVVKIKSRILNLTAKKDEA